jgi:hypothetical protein
VENLQPDQSKLGSSHHLSLHEVLDIHTSLNLSIISLRFLGCGLRENMALYTMADVLLQKSRNSRVWVARSWNWTIRCQRVSFAKKSMSLARARRRRLSTRKFTLCS